MTNDERRRERRLHYHWPVWYGENYEGSLDQGQMIDISSGGAAFTCYADKSPLQGQSITTRFSVPKYGCGNDSFEMENYVMDGRVCRVEQMGPFIHKVALQFTEVLPFRPGEFTDADSEDIEQSMITFA